MVKLITPEGAYFEAVDTVMNRVIFTGLPFKAATFKDEKTAEEWKTFLYKTNGVQFMVETEIKDPPFRGGRFSQGDLHGPNASGIWTATVHDGSWKERIQLYGKTRQEAEELQTQVVDILNIGESLK